MPCRSIEGDRYYWHFFLVPPPPLNQTPTKIPALFVPQKMQKSDEFQSPGSVFSDSIGGRGILKKVPIISITLRRIFCAFGGFPRCVCADYFFWEIVSILLSRKRKNRDTYRDSTFLEKLKFAQNRDIPSKIKFGERHKTITKKRFSGFPPNFVRTTKTIKMGASIVAKKKH
jgi:hypothetical protein